MSKQSFSNDNNSDNFDSGDDNILLSIDIQLTEDETGTLEIRENEDIEEKVNEFCNKYNMSSNLKKILNAQVMEHLEHQINQLEEEEEKEEEEEPETREDDALTVEINEPNGNETQSNDTKFHQGNIPLQIDKDKHKPISTSPPKINNGKYQSFHSFKEIKANGKEDTLAQNSKISEASIKTQSQNEQNKGEKLYKEYIEQLPKKEMIMKKLREEVKDLEGKEASFKPLISTASNNIANKSNHSNNKCSSIEERLLTQGKLQKEKITKKITEKEVQEKQQCSFKPIVPEKSQIIGEIKRKIRKEELPNRLQGINPEYLTDKDLKEKIAYYHDRSYSNISRHNDQSSNSKHKGELSTITKRDISVDVISQRRNRQDVFNRTTKIFHRKVPLPQLNPSKKLHDYLYLESKLIQEKKAKETQKQLKKDCTFTPYIPLSVRNLIPRKETEEEFIKRLAKTKRQREKVVIKKDQFNLFDCSTGKKYFKPTVSRGPKNTNQRDVSINLDSFYDNKLLEQKRKDHEIELCNMLEKKKLFLERSMEIILKMKFEKYKEIFTLLDSDKDGVISSKHIRLSVLDHSLLEAMTPLLEDMQKNDLQMNFKQFCLKVDKLLTVKMFNENECYLHTSMDTTIDKGVNQSNGE